MGWVGNLFIWYGLFKVGSKNRSAFLWTIFGEIIWFGYASYLGLWDLSISCLVFAGLGVWNYRQWGVEPETLHVFGDLVSGETDERYAAQHRAALASLERNRA